LGKFLTYSPRTLKTNFIRENFLSYIDGTSPATTIRVRTYESGATLPTRIFELAIADLSALAGIICISKDAFGGDLTTWNEVTSLWQNLSTKTWNELGGYLVNPNVTQLDICLLNAAGTIVTETFTYQIDDYCSKYEKTNVYWQNSLGGWDSYTFNMVKKKRYNIERKQISTNPYIYGASGYSQHTNNVFNAGNQDYFTNYTEGYVLNSDLLTNEEHAWMWELIKSQNDYDEQLINGVTYYVPSVIKNTNYEPKITKVDGISNISIELEFGYDNIRITR
jgi:hypothetical protein